MLKIFTIETTKSAHEIEGLLIEGFEAPEIRISAFPTMYAMPGHSVDVEFFGETGDQLIEQIADVLDLSEGQVETAEQI